MHNSRHYPTRIAVRSRGRLSRLRRQIPRLVGVVLLSALDVCAQTAERPEVAVGDRWDFVVYYTVPSKVPNRTWVITSIGSDRIHGIENGEPLTLSADLNVVDSPRQSETNPRLLSFPLEVGKRWKYESNWLFKPKSSRGTLSVEVAVASYEPIDVPAGRFAAFKLVAIGELGGSSPSNTFYAGQTTTTYWYAPAARGVVKSIHRNPYQGTTTVELVSFKLQRWEGALGDMPPNASIERTAPGKLRLSPAAAHVKRWAA